MPARSALVPSRSNWNPAHGMICGYASAASNSPLDRRPRPHSELAQMKTARCMRVFQEKVSGATVLEKTRSA